MPRRVPHSTDGFCAVVPARLRDGLAGDLCDGVSPNGAQEQPRFLSRSYLVPRASFGSIRVCKLNLPTAASLVRRTITACRFDEVDAGSLDYLLIGTSGSDPPIESFVGILFPGGRFSSKVGLRLTCRLVFV